ncbi:hypothetical protein IP65_19850 [Novosphingobium sp. AAP1]|nr:hypothetical protein IP65_19850 [Novosphingobium sp. AAP1]
MNDAEEAVGELVISGSDGAVELEMAEHAFDAVPLLIDYAVMVNFTQRFDLPGMTASICRSARSARMASAS